MKHYVKLVRPVNGVMSMIAVWIGTIIAGASFVPALPTLMGMISVFVISGGGMGINDYFDVEIDKVNKPHRPIPSGKISKRAALVFSTVLILIGLGLAYMINVEALITAFAASALLIGYAARMKKTLLMGNLVVSGLVGLTFLYGGMIYSGFLALLPLALLAFLANTGREIYKTIDDAIGDQKYNVNSIAIKLGVIHTRLLGNIFLTLAVILSFVPYLFGILGQVYLFFVVIADAAFIAACITPMKYGSKLIKVAMFIALIAFFAGSISL